MYKGQNPRISILRNKGDSNQILLVDETIQHGTMVIVVTWLPTKARIRFRETYKKFPKRNNGEEIKYSNTSPIERLSIFEDLMQQSLEVYDSYSLPIPPDVTKQIQTRFKKNISYEASVYIYRLEHLLQIAMSEHPGSIDIYCDKFPFEIWDEVRVCCNDFISKGYHIDWFIVTPSNTVTELMVQDMVAGQVAATLVGKNEQDVVKMDSKQKERHLAISEWLSNRRRIK